MPAERHPLWLRTGAALALGLVLGACTAGGQFDPTEIVSSDIFNTKKKISGDREPVFPQGVPGAETGVPPDLGKRLPAAAGGTGALSTTARRRLPRRRPPRKSRSRSQTASRRSPRFRAQQAARPGLGSAGRTPAGAAGRAAPAQSAWPAASGSRRAGQLAGSARERQRASGADRQTNWPAPPPTRQAQ